MNKIQKFKKALRISWYIQGFNATPLYLNHAGISGFTMKKLVGFGYKHFMYNYKDGYGEMYYDPTDLQNIWKKTKQKLKKDAGYLNKLKKDYEKIFNLHEKKFEILIKEKQNSPDELLKIFQYISKAYVDSVSTGHILEGVSLGLEKEIKQELNRLALNQKEINLLYPNLTATKQPSFLKKEETELLKIKKLKGTKREIALKKHSQKYFWIHNNYAKPVILSPVYFKNKLKNLKKQVALKRSVPNKLRLTRELKLLLSWSKTAALWQDERKANILKSLGYFDITKRKIAKAAKINQKYLNFLGVKDIKNLKSINDLNNLKKELKNRSQGCMFLQENFREYVISKKEYQKLINKKPGKIKHSRQPLTGQIANPGKVKGRAVICKGLASLKKVKEGDIIVASMTRPEFMPFLKKAKGIITDEGGVTCHAAIVSRELGIPCIIGTKIATKILRNGDLVELDTNTGSIKIIK